VVIRDFRFDDSDYQAHLKLVEKAKPAWLGWQLTLADHE